MHRIEKVWTDEGRHYARTQGGKVIEIPPDVGEMLIAGTQPGEDCLAMLNVPSRHKSIAPTGAIHFPEGLILVLLNAGALIAGLLILKEDPSPLTLLSDGLIWAGLSIYLVLRLAPASPRLGRNGSPDERARTRWLRSKSHGSSKT